jgi:hypothetical protein
MDGETEKILQHRYSIHTHHGETEKILRHRFEWRPLRQTSYTLLLIFYLGATFTLHSTLTKTVCSSVMLLCSLGKVPRPAGTVRDVKERGISFDLFINWESENCAK